MTHLRKSQGSGEGRAAGVNHVAKRFVGARRLDVVNPAAVDCAVEFLGEIGPPPKLILSQLRKLLANGNGVERVAAAAALCRIEQYESNVPAVVECLRGRDLTVRKAAVQSIGRLGPLATAVLPALREATEDPEVQVRNAARKALAALQSK